MAPMPRIETKTSPYRVQVLDRALAALEVLAGTQKDCSLVELCKALKLHKSTVHRLMMVLEQHRLVDKNPETGAYHLGLKLFEFGSKAIAALDPRRHARPYLDRLQAEVGETVFFCILDDGQVLYLEKVGSRAPAYCTAVGKAMLAELPEAEVNDIIRRSGLKPVTANTITTPAALKAELRSVRSRGYAIDNEEKEPGLRCVSAAVRGHSGKLLAAISVSGPAFRITKERLPAIGEVVMRAAQDLSAEFGYRAAPLEVLRTAVN
jgi:DNA-binding IclR family transcriptional regulator